MCRYNKRHRNRYGNIKLIKVLDPDNIHSKHINLLNLIEYDKNILNVNELIFTEKENKILNEINESSNTNDSEGMIHEEEIGLFGFKLSQLGTASYIFTICAIILTIIIVFGGLFMLLRNNKNKKKKK